MDSKRTIIQKRREEIIKRYGSNARVYSSGEGLNSEKVNPPKMRINLNQKVIEQCFPKYN